RRSLPHPLLPVLVLVVLAAGVVGLMRVIPQEFTPVEDRGGFFIRVNAPEGASLPYTQGYVDRIEAQILAKMGEGEIERILARVPDFGGSEEVSTARFIVSLTPWNARSR